MKKPAQLTIEEDLDKAYKVTIPRSLVDLIEGEPKRFGFDDPDLAERFRCGIAQRKQSVLRRQPGGISGQMRGTSNLASSGKFSPYGDPAQSLNSDPDLYHKGPTLRPRCLEEAQEIYMVLYRGLAYLRLRHSNAAANYMHSVVRRFRIDCLLPMWIEAHGVNRCSGDAYYDAYDESKAKLKAWLLQVRRMSNALVAEFEQDYAGLHQKTILQQATCVLLIPRALVGRAFMWANDPFMMDSLEPKVWDRILKMDLEHNRRGVTLELSPADLNAVSYHLNDLLSTALSADLEISSHDWAALVKLSHEIDNREQSLSMVLNPPEELPVV